jgi:hypothetical protein
VRDLNVEDGLRAVLRMRTYRYSGFLSGRGWTLIGGRDRFGGRDILHDDQPRLFHKLIAPLNLRLFPFPREQSAGSRMRPGRRLRRRR